MSKDNIPDDTAGNQSELALLHLRHVSSPQNASTLEKHVSSFTDVTPGKSYGSGHISFNARSHSKKILILRDVVVPGVCSEAQLSGFQGYFSMCMTCDDMDPKVRN